MNPSTRSAAEIDALLRQHRPLAWGLARRFSGGCRQRREDLQAVALEALWRAILAWDSTRGTFSTLAIPVIKNAIANQVRYENAERRREDSFSLSLDAPNLDGSTLADTIPDKHPDPAELCIARVIVENAMKCLNPKEQTIILARSEGKSLSQIGASIGLSKERIRQIETIAKRRLTNF